MGLILNLPGAISRLRKARTTSEIVRALVIVIEEFYRTLGVLFFTRYITLQRESRTLVHDDVVALVRDQFSNPSFDSWRELGRICGNHLMDMGDKLARQYLSLVNSPIDYEENELAQKILQKINQLGGPAAGNVPDTIRYPHFFTILTRIHDLAEAELFFSGALKALIDLGLIEFTIKIIKEVLDVADILILVPTLVTKEGTKTIIIQGPVSSTTKLPAESEYLRYQWYPYIQFYQDEPAFKFMCGLLHFNFEDEACYIYTKFAHGDTIFENIDLDGTHHKIIEDNMSLEKIFDIPIEEGKDIELLDSAEQRFGKLSMDNDIIHNLAPRLSIYVSRTHAEEELVEKLSHRTFNITTLDGGGGFGKTELARSTIWDLIEEKRSRRIGSVKFRYVVWITGKIQYFEEGSVQVHGQVFSTVEDLIDSILYVTNIHYGLNRSLVEKKRLVIEVLNASEATLLLVDNLETVTEKGKVWDYLVELSDQIKTELRILVTSRIRAGSTGLIVTVRAMEEQEARELSLREMDRLNLSSNWAKDDYINDILNSTGRIPLLIRYFINLISRGYNFDEILGKLPSDSDEALDFMCDYQWQELDKRARKLLTGIAFSGGKLSFAKAKLICDLKDDDFQEAKEQLKLCSFLVDQSLINSTLDLLPPITLFARSRLKEQPDFEDEFIENEALLKTADSAARKQAVDAFTDEIALNQLFQRAELLARQGEIGEAHNWFNLATDRFPRNALAWRTRGEFEYRYLEDDEAANNSFEKASDIEPKNPLIYETWAYWETDRGSKEGRKVRYKKAIGLYQQALEHTIADADKRKTKSFIALAYFKLGLIARDECIRASRHKKEEIAEERDLYFKSAIDILDKNRYSSPTTLEQRIHNSLDCNYLARSFLIIREPWHKDRAMLDDCAITYMIEGLKADKRNYQIRFTLRHPGLLFALERHGKKVDSKSDDQKLIGAVLSLEGNLKEARKIAYRTLEKARPKGRSRRRR